MQQSLFEDLDLGILDPILQDGSLWHWYGSIVYLIVKYSSLDDVYEHLWGLTGLIYRFMQWDNLNDNWNCFLLYILCGKFGERSSHLKAL